MSQVLEQRERTHGEFAKNGQFADHMEQALTCYSGWFLLDAAQREAIRMAIRKIGRAINGDPQFLDHWVDAVGYLQLGLEHTQEMSKGVQK